MISVRGTEDLTQGFADARQALTTDLNPQPFKHDFLDSEKLAEFKATFSVPCAKYRSFNVSFHFNYIMIKITYLIQ